MASVGNGRSATPHTDAEPLSKPAASGDHPLVLAAVDDVPVLLEGVRVVLATRMAIADYTCAATVDELLASGIQPDVVLLDIRLNDGSLPHQNVTRIVKELGAPVLMFSQEAQPSVIQACLAAGAAGMLEKNADADTLAEAVATVATGEPWLSPEWAQVVSDPTWIMPHLAEREQEALRLFAAGLKAATIARRMGVQGDTVGTWLKRIRGKYIAAGRPAPTRTDLYIRAVEDGYCEGPQPL
ncbi:DNA-binding response regulator [Acidipropionibacterium jensenii]|uniref:DNA-binding response regulator n=1 Tax=Acidipropionibacterium jensenii TaxID=1749 RepID=A0A3Q9ULA6_9ACTN|nr:DNA-binding response regulator [Acidipropionibacterium jensenii]